MSTSNGNNNPFDPSKLDDEDVAASSQRTVTPLPDDSYPTVFIGYTKEEDGAVFNDQGQMRPLKEGELPPRIREFWFAHLREFSEDGQQILGRVETERVTMRRDINSEVNNGPRTKLRAILRALMRRDLAEGETPLLKDHIGKMCYVSMAAKPNGYMKMTAWSPIPSDMAKMLLPAAQTIMKGYGRDAKPAVPAPSPGATPAPAPAPVMQTAAPQPAPQPAATQATMPGMDQAQYQAFLAFQAQQGQAQAQVPTVATAVAEPPTDEVEAEAIDEDAPPF